MCKDSLKPWKIIEKSYYLRYMISIVVIGFGNVGKHLSEAFHEAPKLVLRQIYNRSNITLPNSLQQVAFTNNLTALFDADVYVIALPDDHIAKISSKIAIKDSLVVHTSGGVSMDEIDGKNRRGVLYPLQSFSKHRTVDIKTVPVCIEAESMEDLELLRKLGKQISGKVEEISSEDRASLHLSAVFVNNFVNHLYHISEELLQQKNIDFDLLKPLISETAKKIEELSPSEAQTGPAIRNDEKTLKKHLEILKDSPYETLYRDLTASIKKTYGKKL